MKKLNSVVFFLFRTVIPTVLGLLVLVGVIAWLAGLFTEKIEPGRTEPSRPMRETLQTGTVREVTKDYIEEAVGTLKAASRTEVSAKVLATIEEVAVSAGDLVNKGDVVVRLDHEEMQSRKDQAEQALLVAAANRKNAETAFARVKQLKDRQVASQSEYDQAVAQKDVALAQESQARQAIEEAKIILSYTEITAPKAGRVVDRLAEPGDTARPGQPLLVIYDADSLRLEAPVLEKLAVRLKIGDRLMVHVDAIDRAVEAVVDQIVPQADAASRSFLVKSTLPQTDNLYEGMFGRLLIPAGQRRHLCLPTAAIRDIGQLQFVDVVRDDASVERRMIRTGRLGIEGHVEVLSGLTAGEQVVLHESAVDLVPSVSKMKEEKQQ